MQFRRSASLTIPEANVTISLNVDFMSEIESCTQSELGNTIDPTAAGFWRRAWAGYFIDSFVLMQALSPLFAIGDFTTRDVMLVTIIVSTFLGTLYVIHFHTIWGQSFGRVMLGIKLIDLKGGMPSAKQVWLRYSIDLGLAGVIGIFHTVAILGVTKEEFEGSNYYQRVFLPFSVLSFGGMIAIGVTWQLLNLIVFFTNPERRTIRDYLAGTRVIRLSTATDYPKKRLVILGLLTIVTQQALFRSLLPQAQYTMGLFAISLLVGSATVALLLRFVLEARRFQGPVGLDPH